jgi:hypothetical protein
VIYLDLEDLLYVASQVERADRHRAPDAAAADRRPYITAMIVSGDIRSLPVAEGLGMTLLRSDVLRDLPVIAHSIDRPAPGAQLD